MTMKEFIDPFTGEEIKAGSEKVMDRILELN